MGTLAIILEEKSSTVHSVPLEASRAGTALASLEDRGPHMLNRRDFISKGTATFLLVPALACSTGYGSPATGAACAGLDATSPVTLGHTHTVCIPNADLMNPPAGGATYSTSGPDPTHTVTLSSGQLSMIAAGQSVTVTTSTNGSHNHQFVLA